MRTPPIHIENPTPFTNFLQMVLIFAIPAGLTYTFGKMVGNTGQGWAIFSAMSLLFLIGVGDDRRRAGRQPAAHNAGANPSQPKSPASAPGGNMEGKEIRFGITSTSLFAVITTAASCGAVNAMHDLVHAAGRTDSAREYRLGRGHLRRGRRRAVRHPDLRGDRYLHRRPDGRTHAGISRQEDRADRNQDGDAGPARHAHCHSRFFGDSARDASRFAKPAELGPARSFRSALCLYIGCGNNGSAFAGLSANTPFYNVRATLAIAMFVGRFIPILAVLGLAGSLAIKKRATVSAGTFPTTGVSGSGYWSASSSSLARSPIFLPTCSGQSSNICRFAELCVVRKEHPWSRQRHK